MDRSEIYGNGFNYPFGFSENTGGVVGSSAESNVVSCLVRLFDTAPGEEFMRPDYGCALKRLVFENDTEAFRAMAMTAVRSAVAKWEPRVREVIDLRIEDDPEDPNHILIRVYFRLIKDQQVYNFVYPFQLPS